MRVNMYKNITLIALSSIVLAGCVDKNVIKDKTAFLYEKTPDTKIIDTLPMTSVSKELGDFTDIERNIFEEEYKKSSTYFLMPDSELKTYVFEVANKLISSLPSDKKPDFEIEITTEQTITAHATINNKIYISLGTLLNLKSEDELAYLLGHELAHLALHHNEKTYERESKSRFVASIADNAIDYGNELFTLKAQLQGTNRLNAKDSETLDSSISKVSRIKKHMGHLQDGLLNPYEENHADFLAIDMMVNAGYNRNAVGDVLKTLNSYRSNTANRMKRQEEALNNASLELTNTVNMMVSSGTINTEGTEQIIKSNLENISLSSVEDVLDKVFTKTHFNPDKRLQTSSDYMLKHYATMRKPFMKSEQYQEKLQSLNIDQLVADMTLIQTLNDELDSSEQLSQARLDQIATPLLGALKRNKENGLAWLAFAKLRKHQGRNADYVENLEISSQKTNPNYESFKLLIDAYSTSTQNDLAQETYLRAKEIYQYSELLIPSSSNELALQ